MNQLIEAASLDVVFMLLDTILIGGFNGFKIEDQEGIEIWDKNIFLNIYRLLSAETSSR